MLTFEVEFTDGIRRFSETIKTHDWDTIGPAADERLTELVRLKRLDAKRAYVGRYHPV